MSRAIISTAIESTSARMLDQTGVQRGVAYEGASGRSSNQDWDRVQDELLSFIQLSDDWDGQGAVRPRPDLVGAAINWLRSMPSADSTAVPPSYVSAAPCGEVLLVWETEHDYLEAEVVGADRVEWMRVIGDLAAEHWASTPNGVVIRSMPTSRW